MLDTTIDCTICGDDFDPTTTPEVNSTHLCPCCAAADGGARPSILLFPRAR